MNRKIQTIFDNWNEKSAYLFGFWWADGNIELHRSHNNLLKCFCVYNTNLQIMNDLSLILGNKIYTRYKKKYKPYHRIVIYSDKMFDFCYRYTHSITKSDKEIPFPKIPKKFFNHFIRGYFDGDGSINYKIYKNRHKKITKSLQTSFTAGKDTGNFLQHLKEQLRLFIPVGDKKVYKGTSYKLMFNQYDSMLLCQWMYKDATIYMKRKKDIWDTADKERLLKSTKYFSNKV